MSQKDDTDSREFYEERVAIMEFDGGLPRRLAQYYAVIATARHVERTGCTPPRDPYYEITARYLTGNEPIDPEWPEVEKPWGRPPRGRR